MKALILVSVTYVLLLNAGQTSANEQRCKITNLEKHFTQLDIFFNELRHRAALGKKYQTVALGEGGLMYYLNRTDSLQKDAQEMLKSRSKADSLKSRSIIFRRELDAVYGGAYTSVYQLVEMMRINPEILGQMLYPHATRYGCYVKGFSKESKCYLKGACVFDKEAPLDYKLEKKACTKNDDCTYEKPATCLYPLCYAQKK